MSLSFFRRFFNFLFGSEVGKMLGWFAESLKMGSIISHFDNLSASSLPAER